MNNEQHRLHEVGALPLQRGPGASNLPHRRDTRLFVICELPLETLDHSPNKPSTFTRQRPASIADEREKR